MDFGVALQEIKKGSQVARMGWNGKGMFIELAGPYTTGSTNSSLFIHMKTAQGYYVPWVASQSDLLADDWEVVGVRENNECLRDDPITTFG